MFVAKALITYATPVVLVTFCCSLWLAYSLVESLAGWRDDPEAQKDDDGGESASDQPVYHATLRTRVTVTALVLFLMFHPTLTKTTFAFFKCTARISDRSLLAADLDIVCGDDFHRTLQATVATPALLVYVLGVSSEQSER